MKTILKILMVIGLLVFSTTVSAVEFHKNNVIEFKTLTIDGKIITVDLIFIETIRYKSQTTTTFFGVYYFDNGNNMPVSVYISQKNGVIYNIVVLETDIEKKTVFRTHQETNFSRLKIIS